MASDRSWGDREEKKVILDSSAIMMLFEFSINLDDELTKLIGKHRIIVPRPILEELEFLSENGKGKKKTYAKASLKLLQKYDVVDANDKLGDDSVLFLAKKLNGIVTSNDRELRKRAKKLSLHTVFLRGKNVLVLQ